MNIYNSLDANPQSNPNDNYEIGETVTCACERQTQQL